MMVDEPTTHPLLQPGTVDAAVLELHTLLTLAGYLIKPPLQPDAYGPESVKAVIAFQRQRDLEPTGLVDIETWQSLHAASQDFGSRLMCYRTPMMRGDDVGELQLMLSSLGFDSGWIDGIFGGETEKAVADFQRNAGLPVDGIAGPTTCSTLLRLRLSANAAARPVASVIEREKVHGDLGSLVGRKIVVGELGMTPTVTGAVGARLRAEGARVLLLHHPNGSTHARSANQFDAKLYLGIAACEEPSCSVSFYKTESFSSYGGQHLAELLATPLSVAMRTPCSVEGRRVAVLRDTRMPAALMRLGPIDDLTSVGDRLADTIAEAIHTWVLNPTGA